MKASVKPEATEHRVSIQWNELWPKLRELAGKLSEQVGIKITPSELAKKYVREGIERDK